MNREGRGFNPALPIARLKTAERGEKSGLTDPQFIYLLKRRSAFTTNDRAAVAAYQRFRNVLATSGAIERFAFLAFVFVHLFACFSEEEFT
jgi:hypothetical protein